MKACFFLFISNPYRVFANNKEFTIGKKQYTFICLFYSKVTVYSHDEVGEFSSEACFQTDLHRGQNFLFAKNFLTHNV